MTMWRCPHCGTPQPETARCWVCRRSSTACATCREFRRSVAGSLGYCALDRRRSPLQGDEIRSCWDAAPTVAPIPVEALRTRPGPADPADGSRRFIEVEADDAPTHPSEPLWSLWSDLDR